VGIAYRTRAIGEVEVFYREAGRSDGPVLLLLHGFPSASHYFAELIPLLADRWRVIAPDLPGFGQTKSPPRERFAYTFDHLAQVIADFTEALGLARYALYVFDYGAPVGFRLAMTHPERVTAIVSQNGNAYLEGLSPRWETWQRYWREPTPEKREACRGSVTPEAIRTRQHLNGVSDPTRVSPDGWMLDAAYMARPGREEIQLDLILDYRTNVALYPKFQEYFRTHRPPLLAAWGRNDVSFLPAGAEAFRRDLPNAEVHLLDAGHFALDTHTPEIAGLVRDFLVRTERYL
jgi:pimeloyl-ACP methyl ester carboxylesterase